MSETISDKMSIESDKTDSMSVETSSTATYEMELEDMLQATTGIVDKLDATSKFLEKLKDYSQPTYIIKTPEGETKLVDALEILQGVSSPETFGANILKFLQNAIILSK